MATIFSKVCMVDLWDSQAVTSLPHFQLDGYNFQNHETLFIQLYADVLQCN